MRIAAAVYEKAVGVVTLGQVNREGFNPVSPQTLGELTGGSLPTAVAIGIESQVDRAGSAVAELLHLRPVQAGPYGTGDVGETRLPQHGQIEQSLDQNDLRTGAHFLPSIEPALASGQ